MKKTKTIKVEKYYDYPASVPVHLVQEFLTAGSKACEIPDRKAKISKKNYSYGEMETNNEIRAELKTDFEKSKFTVFTDNLNTLNGNNKPAKKLFDFALILANKQALYRGHLQKDYISFPLQSLVDVGAYDTIRSARKGFMDGLNALTSLKVSGVNKDRETLFVLFTGGEIRNGICTIYLNNQLNWKKLYPYFTVLPAYRFRLSNRASDLLNLIFYRARQETDNINATDQFNISLKLVHQALMLPGLIGNRKPNQYIVEPIKNAIDEIMSYNDDCLQLEIIANDKKAKKFLDGYLNVKFYGEYKTVFSKIALLRQEKIEQKTNVKQAREPDAEK